MHFAAFVVDVVAVENDFDVFYVLQYYYLMRVDWYCLVVAVVVGCCLCFLRGHALRRRRDPSSLALLYNIIALMNFL